MTSLHEGFSGEIIANFSFIFFEFLRGNLNGNADIAGMGNFGKGEKVENFSYKTSDKSKGIKDLRNELKVALSPALNVDITNKQSGITARISSTGLNKIASKKAVDKSVKNGFTRDEHFKVGGDLKNLFENAILGKSTQPSVDLAIHRFNIRVIVNNKNANALITLKESIDKNKNRIYSLELESLNSLP